MKRIFIIALALGLLVSCKKGENDPGLSFRSRDKKIVGEWTVESFENYNLNQNGNSKTEIKQTYSGLTITTTNTTGSQTNTAVGTTSYKGNLTINKDGTAVYTEVSTFTNSSTTRTFNGTWMWGNSKKNKSELFLNFASFNSQLILAQSFRIDELRNKKIVLKENFTNIVSSTTTSTETNNYTLTLVQ
ncbi:MAG: hypothetical protein Q8K70_10145 [Bacteroidota bacterium]|nr:hypothetical protein [Bacteroidota bacterium]